MTTARRRRPKGQSQDSGAADYRADLWRMADALRGSMDAAEYKHVVLGLIFLKYISDAFEETHARLEAERDQGADPEDRDEYLAQDVFWVPAEARWPSIQAQARQSTIGQVVDAAMAALERDNLALKDILPNEYGRDALDKQRLGQVVDLVSNIKVGGSEARATDVLGRVYEYFLEQFALAEGRKGGEFYTPRSVVRLLVEMLEPYQGRGLRPLLRLLGDVRPVGGVHPRPRHGQRQRRQGTGRPFHLRAGVQLHDLAAGKNEPGDPGHRGPDRAGRQLPQRPPPRPAGRLHPGQPALQRLRLGRRPAA